MSAILDRVVSIQDGMFVCTDGAGFFTRPATEDEGLFWAEVIRLRKEHEEDLARMERATTELERQSAIIRRMAEWLEKNQPDVFQRGLWEAING